MVKKQKIINNNQGFTLFEVMIAIVIFTVFASVFVTGQGQNVLDSAKLKSEMTMKDLAENKINDIIANPPEFRDSLTLSKETKDFEHNTDYQYTIEYKKFVVPDMNKLKNSADDDDNSSAQQAIQQKIWTTFKENMEKIIWQVEVTVKDKNSGDNFRISTWLYNQNADVKITGF